MPEAFAVSHHVLPPPIVSAPGTLSGNQRSPSDRFGRLAKLAASVARGRAALKEQSDQFDRLCREAHRIDVTPDELEQAAQTILESEQQAAAALAPQIEQLERNLARQQPSTGFVRSARRLLEEGLEIAQTWLELYQNIRILLLKLASDRRLAAGEVGSPILSNADEMENFLRRSAER